MIFMFTYLEKNKKIFLHENLGYRKEVATQLSALSFML